MKVEFFIAGHPAGAGSKHGFAVRRKNASGSFEYTGKVAMLDTSGEKGKTWRSAIHSSAFEAMKKAGIPLFDGPVTLTVEFLMPRPKKHFVSNDTSKNLRDDSPTASMSGADIDKLERQLNDSLTGVVFRDDKQVVEVHKFKRYGSFPGAKVSVESFAENSLTTKPS